MWRTLMPPPSAELILTQLNRQLAVPEAARTPDHVDGVCLVGALVRAGSRPPEAESDVGRAVDAVYDALWASRGQPGPPLPGGAARTATRGLTGAWWSGR
jgi:hypothetical protein